MQVFWGGGTGNETSPRTRLRAPSSPAPGRPAAARTASSAGRWAPAGSAQAAQAAAPAAPAPAGRQGGSAPPVSKKIYRRSQSAVLQVNTS